jgi:hypothetical protein
MERRREPDFRILDVLISPHQKNGGKPMNTEMSANWRYPSAELAQRMHDVLLVSSFALWAMLIGFAPVMTWRLLVS